MMTSTEISLHLDIVMHGNRVYGFFNPQLVSKADFSILCRHVLRRSQGCATLFEYVNAPPPSEIPRNLLTSQHPQLVITALRLMAASKWESEIVRAKENGLGESSEEIRTYRRDLVDVLRTALETAPELLITQAVQKWLQRSRPRSESHPPSLAPEA